MFLQVARSAAVKRRWYCISLSLSSASSSSSSYLQVYPVIPPAQGLNQRQIKRVSIIIIVGFPNPLAFQVMQGPCLCHHGNHHRQKIAAIILNHHDHTDCFSLTRKYAISLHPLGLIRFKNRWFENIFSPWNICIKIDRFWPAKKNPGCRIIGRWKYPDIVQMICEGVSPELMEELNACQEFITLPGL